MDIANRRSAWLALLPAMTGVTLLASVAPAFAQNYPTKPIRIIVPFAASGTGTDLVARVAADFITSKTGQTVTVQNRGGAGGNLGMNVVAKAAPDGYTIGMALATNVVVNPHIYKTMPFDALKDLLPVAPAAATSQLIVVNEASPARTLQELIARQGATGQDHLRIGRDRNDRASRRPRLCTAGRAEARPCAVPRHRPRGWRSRRRQSVLAAATPRRLSYLPDVPTAAEAGLPGFKLSSWFGVFAPSGTPKEIVATLNGYIHEVLQDAAARKRLDDSHLDAMTMSPDEFARFVAADHVSWQRTILL